MTHPLLSGVIYNTKEIGGEVDISTFIYSHMVSLPTCFYALLNLLILYLGTGVTDDVSKTPIHTTGSCGDCGGG